MFLNANAENFVPASSVNATAAAALFVEDLAELEEVVRGGVCETRTPRSVSAYSSTPRGPFSTQSSDTTPL